MEQIGSLKEQETLNRLTIPATFVSHRRGLRKVYPKYALLKIDSVKTKAAAKNYIGNAVEYIREGKNGSKKRNFGVITRAHGNSGALQATFKTNLPPQDVGKIVRVKLYKIDVDEFK